MTLRRTLRVLIWLEHLPVQGGGSIRELDILRCHLRHDLGNVCDIQLLVSKTNARLISQVKIWDLHVTHVENASAEEGAWPEIDSPSLRQAVATGRSHDCDYIVVPDELLPYLPVVEQYFHFGLVDPSFLLKCVEIFVRGFGVVWSFADPVFNGTLNTLYVGSELRETFSIGFTLMDRLVSTKQDSTTIECGRSLFFNRMAHVCYSRDQLLFYLFQRDAALRETASRQPFDLELTYHLNFYYILLYGALDHAAVLVNRVCRLNVEKAGATRKAFLKALEPASPTLHTIFTDTATEDLLKNLGELRHLTAHRGSIIPTILVERHDKNPTDEELDAYLSESGQDPLLLDFADSPRRAEPLEFQRSIAKMELLEKNPLARDIVPIELDGKTGWMRPLFDVTWNFRSTLSFLHRVFEECVKILT